MVTYVTPGVYKEERFPEPTATLQTGVPAFLGYTREVGKKRKLLHVPQQLTRWQQFEQHFGAPLANGYLGAAVRGFFENGGRQCYVVPLDSSLPAETSLASLSAGLAALAPLETLDLVCAPDIMGRPQPDNRPAGPYRSCAHCKLQYSTIVTTQAIVSPYWMPCLVATSRLCLHNGADCPDTMARCTFPG